MHGPEQIDGSQRARPLRILHDDFFRLDDCLDRVFSPGAVHLDPVVRSIFVRTVLAAELLGSSAQCVLPPFATLIDSAYLTLYYSRFFEISPGVRPPPGPRPTLRPPTLASVARYGLLLRSHETIAANLLAGLWGKSGLPEAAALLLADNRGLVRGVQILSSGGGRRLLLVQALAPDDSRSGSPCNLSAPIGFDRFERAGRDARYWPQACNLAGQSGTLCFRRRERRALSQSYAALSLPLTET